jgi:GcrA cell cycle regulator
MMEATMRAGDLDWTQETISELKKLVASGLSYADVGRRLGVSKSSISGKMERLGLRQRPRITHGLRIGDRAQKREKEKRKNMRYEEEKMRHGAVQTLKKSVIELPRRHVIEPCCWVIDRDAKNPYCDEPSEPGKSMCAKHRAIAVRPNMPHGFHLPAE